MVASTATLPVRPMPLASQVTPVRPIALCPAGTAGSERLQYAVTRVERRTVDKAETAVSRDRLCHAGRRVASRA